MELHVNHRFVLDFARRNAAAGRILDYGCGSGQVVRAGLQQRLEIYGCEAFYEGGHGSRSGASDLLGSRILEMSDGRIPFPDEWFDCIVNNMVFEHIHDVDQVLAEICRVLKPGGRMLSLFPSRECLREGHCGVPLAHRFSHHPKLGYYWLLVFRCLGFGHFTKGKGRRQWARGFQTWLNNYCAYRPREEILRAFSAPPLETTAYEKEYLRFRHLPWFMPWTFRKLGFMVLLSEKSTLRSHTSGGTIESANAGPIQVQ
jgi:SAM-dependent methyltransferase